jgi:DNA-binding beta-propeller fold protein YncE
VAYDQSKGEVLVANEWNYIPNTVSVISDVNDSVVAKLDVGYSPLGLAYDSGGGEVFVANTGDKTLDYFGYCRRTGVPRILGLACFIGNRAVCVGLGMRSVKTS